MKWFWKSLIKIKLWKGAYHHSLNSIITEQVVAPSSQSAPLLQLVVNHSTKHSMRCNHLREELLQLHLVIIHHNTARSTAGSKRNRMLDHLLMVGMPLRSFDQDWLELELLLIGCLQLLDSVQMRLAERQATAGYSIRNINSNIPDSLGTDRILDTSRLRTVAAVGCNHKLPAGRLPLLNNDNKHNCYYWMAFEVAMTYFLQRWLAG